MFHLARHQYRGEEFIRFLLGLAVSRDEVGERHATHPGGGHQFDFGVQDKQRGHTVCCRGRVAHISCNGCAILNLHRADFPGCGFQGVETWRQGRTQDFSPRCECSDTEVNLFARNSTKLGNRGDVHHIALRKAFSQCRIKIGAPGQDLATQGVQDDNRIVQVFGPEIQRNRTPRTPSGPLRVCIRSPRLCTASARKQVPHLVRAIVEDPFDIALYPKTVGNRSADPQGKRIREEIMHGCSSPARLERVLVIPQSIGAGKCSIDKFVRRTPGHDLPGPADRKEMPPKLVPDEGSGRQFCGCLHYAEIQPRRRELLQVFRPRKKTENFFQWSLHPLLPLEEIEAHRVMKHRQPPAMQ